MGLVQKSFSDIITFSRSSNATRVGPTGVLEYAPHNLILQSEAFGTTWATGAASIVSNSIAAPNGTITADKLVEDNTNSDHAVYQSVSVPVGASTFSVYVKAAGRTKFQLREGSNGDIYNFDLSSPSGNITSVGNGWYRCWLTATPASTTFIAQIYLRDSAGNKVYTGDGTSGIYVWGAQLSVGPYALDYTPTTSAAVYGPRFDYDGSGVTIVEPVSRNLLTYSADLSNAAWDKINSTVTTDATTAPDGTTSADLVLENTSTGGHAVGMAAVALSSAAYTVSIFAKYYNRQWIRFDPDGLGTQIYFDIQNGVVGTVAAGCTASITAVGNGWYRCVVSGTFAAKPYFGLASANGTAVYTGDASKGAYLWGAQLEVGSTATGYMVSGATNGFRAVPVVSGSATARGLLVEESRTNLATYSEDFSNAAWVSYSASKTATFAAAPNGTITANRISENASNTLQAIYNTISTSTTGARTVSVFAKAAERSFFRVSLSGAGATEWFGATFDLQNGTVTQQNAGAAGTVSGATITAFGSGWYRCTVTGNTGSTGVTYAYIGPALTGTPSAGSFGVLTYSGNSSNGVLAWGAQVEQASFATSYIPTLASTVTRSADVASVNTLSPWFNATEGTLFAEASRPALGGAAAFACLSTDANNRIQIGNRTGGGGTARLDYWVSTLGVDQAYLTFDNTFAANTPAKIAGAYKADDFAASANGATTKTDSSGSVPAIVSLLLGANTTTPSTILNGHLRRVAFFPRRLSNAELQALTA